MLDAYDEWLDRHIADSAKRLERERQRADEERRLRILEEKRLEKAKLISDIVTHFNSQQDTAVRAQLVERLRQQPDINNHEVMAEFSRDFIGGKPITSAHILAINRFISILKTEIR